MTITSRTKGRIAEQAAAEFLLSQGYRIECMNYHTRYGEIDIIAYENEELAFVEVRSGTTNAFIDPILTIDAAKCKKIIKSAQCYLMNSEASFKGIRFDVVIVKDISEPQFYLIKNAFFAT